MQALDETKRGALLGFDNSMRAQVPQLEEMFSLRLRREKAELSFFLFMRSTFDDYLLTEKTITFKTSSNSKKYNELVQGIHNAIKDAEAYQKRQLNAIEVAKSKAQELAR